MVKLKDLEAELKQIGCQVDLWGFTELSELAKVLTPEEQIASVINGVYEGGFALLCVTDHRVLLVDKKPFLLTVEDLRYDMIAEVDYKAHIIMASFDVLTPTRNLRFSTWNRNRLHNAMSYVQQRLLEMRNRQSLLHGGIEQGRMTSSQQFHTMPVAGGIASPFGQLNDIDRSSPGTIMNPYTKAPILSRRRRYPNFYSSAA